MTERTQCLYWVRYHTVPESRIGWESYTEVEPTGRWKIESGRKGKAVLSIEVKRFWFLTKRFWFLTRWLYEGELEVGYKEETIINKCEKSA